jgi:hypothetical protein
MKEEKLYTFIVISNITNISKIVIAVDKHHAVNKALWSFPDHSVFDLKILKKL